MVRHPDSSWFARAANAIVVMLGAALATTGSFLVLPLLAVISGGPPADLVVTSVTTADVPPPPPPVAPEVEEPPEEPEDRQPRLDESPQPLDLAQLELALGGGAGDGPGTGDLAIDLSKFTRIGQDASDAADALFSLADLDQAPRVVHQPSPVLSPDVTKRAPGTAHVLFVVEADGRVAQPVVQNSTDPVFERPALAAVKQWRFEPGRRNGKPVRFRMRVPITFPRG